MTDRCRTFVVAGSHVAAMHVCARERIHPKDRDLIVILPGTEMRMRGLKRESGDRVFYGYEAYRVAAECLVLIGLQ